MTHPTPTPGAADGDPAVRASDLSKVYPLTGRSADPLRALFGRGAPRDGRHALEGVSFVLPRGGCLGIVGRNGSGKSTLLALLAGSLHPTAGRAEVRGRVAALLDLGAGIDPEFTGRENARLLGLLAGGIGSEVSDQMAAVHEFSGLGRAFDLPVKTYSSGMRLRLAFSAAVHAAPDVLLIDEALAVGDAFFQQRCLKRIRALHRSGCTIALVSHDTAAIVSLCDRALWLEGGRVAAEGDPAEVVRRYLAARYRDRGSLDDALVAEPRDRDLAPEGDVEPATDLPRADERFGDGRARVTGVAVRDETGRSAQLAASGESLRVVVSVEAHEALERPLVGFTVRNRLGDIVTATNTEPEGCALAPLAAGERLTVAFDLAWPPLATGTYAISPAVAEGVVAAHRMCDWVENALLLEAHNPRALFGWLHLDAVRVRVARGDAVAPEGRRAAAAGGGPAPVAGA